MMGRGEKQGWVKWIVVAGSVAALLVGLSPEGQAETTFQRIRHEKLITLGIANEPPYTIAAVGGNITGVDPEILKAIMNQYGVEKYVGVVVDFAALIPGLVAKRFDVISAGMYIRPARCKQIDFSNPTLLIHQALVVKKGNPLNLRSLKDIAANPKARVAAEQGSSQVDYLAWAGVKDSQISKFSDNTSSFQALRTDRVDAVLNDSPIANGQLSALKDPNLVLADSFEQPVDKNGKEIIGRIGVGFRKGDKDLRDAYNQGLQKLVNTGKLVEIIAPFGFAKADVPPAGLTAAQVCAGS